MPKLRIKKGYSNHGSWFICAGMTPLGFAIDYLHSDGEIRHGCLDEKTGKYTGWYKTREAARQAVRAYKAKNDPCFYIGKSVLVGEFFVVLQTAETGAARYVHEDGKVYWYAIGGGWFPTEADAIKAVCLYKKLNELK